MLLKKSELVQFTVAAICCALSFYLGAILFKPETKAKPDDHIQQKIAELTAAYQEMLRERVSEAKTAKPASKPALNPAQSVEPKKIVIFTLPNCPPCKAWVATQPQRFRDAGWEVVEVKQGSYPYNHPYTVAPTFSLTQGSKSTVYVGSLSLETAEVLIAR
jgi:hypothetical protein